MTAKEQTQKTWKINPQFCLTLSLRNDSNRGILFYFELSQPVWRFASVFCFFGTRAVFDFSQHYLSSVMSIRQVFFQFGSEKNIFIGNSSWPKIKVYKNSHTFTGKPQNLCTQQEKNPITVACTEHRFEGLDLISRSTVASWDENFRIIARFWKVSLNLRTLQQGHTL